MRKWISVILVNLVFSSFAFAKTDLVSPFRSTVPGLDIPNSHFVDKTEGLIVRGMRPRTLGDAKQLKEIGITHVLIFRDAPKNDESVAEERALFKKVGIPEQNVSVIPFPWKDIKGFDGVCRQTVQALKIMKGIAQKKGEGLFFHCTVGEDRTGYLAGLYHVVLHGAEPTQVWRDEMCENGYADGDPKKPKDVAKAVHMNLSVLFQKMLYKMKGGFLSAQKLDEKECGFDPQFAKEFASSASFSKCEPSSHFDPTVQ